MSIKTAIRRLLEYSGTGNWIYTRRVLNWIANDEIMRQLPFGTRLFCAYARFYNRLVGTPTILLAHGVFRLARWMDRESTVQRRLQIGQHTAWLDLRDPGSLWAIGELARESRLGSLIKRLALDADLFIDAGANQGIFTVLANTVMSPQARIIAIEPQPRLADCVRKSLSSNPARQGTVEQAVLSDIKGVVSLFVPPENQGEAHISTPRTGASIFNVSSITLDQLTADVKRGANIVVKMDVEGAELSALRRGMNFLRSHRPTLVLEINPEAMSRYDYSPADLASFLQEVGYSSWALVDDPTTERPLGQIPRTQCDILLTDRPILT